MSDKNANKSVENGPPDYFDMYVSPEKYDIDWGDVEPEMVRAQLLGHESQLRAIGSLHKFFSLLLFGFGLYLLTNGRGMPGMLNILFSSMGWIIGGRIENLRTWTRRFLGITSTIGLLAFPIGTVFGAYTLFLLLSKNGKRIFTSTYQTIILKTPDIHDSRGFYLQIFCLFHVITTLAVLALLHAIWQK